MGRYEHAIFREEIGFFAEGLKGDKRVLIRTKGSHNHAMVGFSIGMVHGGGGVGAGFFEIDDLSLCH